MCEARLFYKGRKGSIYARETRKDKEWKVYILTNNGTQLTCINKTEEYPPKKYSSSVYINVSAGGKISIKIRK